MVVVYRGMGVAIPVLLVISAGVLAFFFDDTRLGNLEYVGWAIIITGGLSVLPGLAAFGDEEGKWWHHSFFFVPILAWSVVFLAAGIYFVSTYVSPAERIRGTWEFSKCTEKCPDGFADRMSGLKLYIGESDVRVGEGKKREYELTEQSQNFVAWKYKDDGSTERSYLMGDDKFMGVITSGGKDIRVVFARVTSL